MLLCKLWIIVDLIIHSEHEALRLLNRHKKVSDHPVQFDNEFQPVIFMLCHTKGMNNYVADALGRRPHPTSQSLLILNNSLDVFSEFKLYMLLIKISIKLMVLSGRLVYFLS